MSHEDLDRIAAWFLRHQDDLEPPVIWTRYFAELLVEVRMTLEREAAGSPASQEQAR